MALSGTHGFPLIVAWGQIVRGSALSHMGRAAEGISEMRTSLDHQRAMRSRLERSYCLTMLAEALGRVGAYEEGLTLCDEALEFAQRTEARCYEPETHRVRGEMLLCLGDDSRLWEAEVEFKSALEQARRARCRLLELRAGISYLRLRRRMGDVTGGRALLSEVMDSFGEGTNSPVVAEARMLLA
jgi:predicted ATPase